MSTLTYDEAKKAEGQTFKATLEDNREVTFTLVEVVERKSADYPGKTREAFSLTFKGAPDEFCGQSIYKLTNDTVGEQEIFLVPIACDDQTHEHTYQAAFH